MPEVASNHSTTNDRFGAVTAVSEFQDDFRFVPEPDPCYPRVGGELRQRLFDDSKI